MNPLTWQNPGQLFVAQVLKSLIYNSVVELRSIENFYSDEDLYDLKIKNAQWQYIINRPNLPFTTY